MVTIQVKRRLVNRKPTKVKMNVKHKTNRSCRLIAIMDSYK